MFCIDLREIRRLLLYTLTEWLCMTKGESFYCATRTVSLHGKRTVFIFENFFGLIFFFGFVSKSVGLNLIYDMICDIMIRL